jgi:N-acetylmuramoyl-L-alanine amidase
MKRKILILWLITIAIAIVICALTYHKPIKANLQNTENQNTENQNTENQNTVVIDAGHGGVDGGCVGLYDIIEKDITLFIATKLEKLFIKNGYNAVMTRNFDVSIHSDDKKSIRNKKSSDLINRARLANESRGIVYISIHLNKFSQEGEFGSQVFYKGNDEQGKKYARSIMLELKKLNEKNRRVANKLPNKNLLFNKLEIPAVLVECGFISNNNEALLLKTDEYQQKLAEAIFKGVVNLK